MNFKKGLIILLMPMLFIFLAGCGENLLQKKENNLKDGETTIEEPIPYSSELAGIFPQEVDATLYYEGIVEYGHVLTIRDIKVSADKQEKLIKAEGFMADGLGPIGVNGEIRKFNQDYSILKDRVVEKFYNSTVGTNTFQSIIPEKIIIKTPLTAGTSWSQSFKLQDGKNYTANTSIVKTEVVDSKEGKNIIRYTVKTIVDNIPEYKDNRYIETMVFETGKGMTEFKNSIKGYVGEGGKLEFIDFDFQYHLSKITKEHYTIPEVKNQK